MFTSSSISCASGGPISYLVLGSACCCTSSAGGKFIIHALIATASRIPTIASAFFVPLR